MREGKPLYTYSHLVKKPVNCKQHATGRQKINSDGVDLRGWYIGYRILN